MAQNERSNYQNKVISSYYDNLNGIMLVKLQELVTDLYLADTKAKKDRLWDRAHKAMINLKIKPNIIGHIMQKKDVEVLAKNLQDWLSPTKKK
ncbi:MAG: hypothetical protein E4H40_06205 [Candidatus Brocadiia bacterium]|nr:MAG: hypothetical protein E4H40_06205 [Candidatus Brocadiia bacterium]